MNKVIRFTASWCQPCKALASIMEGIDSNVPIEVVDIDDNEALAMKYNIRGVPTLVKLDENGQVLNKMVGVKAKNLVEEFIND